MMQITECLGTMPPSARTVSVALIPKATGGHRPVCIGTAYMRLYSRARSPIVSKWEERFRRAFLSSAKATGAIEAVWRQALDAEEAVEQGGHAAAILWDLEAFFVTVDLELLEERAKAMGFPPAILQVALSMYRSPRMLGASGCVAAPLEPRRGIMAGCIFAKALVTAYYVLPLDKWDASNEGVELEPTSTISLWRVRTHPRMPWPIE